MTEQSRTRILDANRDSRREAISVKPRCSKRSLLADIVLVEAEGLAEALE